MEEKAPDTSCSKTVSGHKWLKLWQAWIKLKPGTIGHLSADGHLLMQLHWKVQMPSEDPHVAESDGAKAGATLSSPTAVLVSSGGDNWLHGVGGRGRGDSFSFLV